MGVYKSKSVTADGRCWFFKCNYHVYGKEEPQLKVSKKYATREEASEAESDFIKKMDESKYVPSDMKFQDLWESFLDFKKDKIKFTTLQRYEYDYKHFKCFMKVKCIDYNYEQYNQWKKKMNSKKDLSTRTKNDILKEWKAILNYGTNRYGFNFMSVYRKMNKFSAPNEIKKEMSFYTLDEFKKFISGEDDMMYKCFWETLFYCGLRCGEARGLTWNCVDLNKKTISINKQVQDPPRGSGLKFIVTAPKTKTSNRVIPICDRLCEDLKSYKSSIESIDNFKSSYYVFGRDNGLIPFEPNHMRERKKRLAELAGIKVIRTHDFRHSCASLLINSGGNVTMVAKYLGHSELEETLNTYSHLFPSALDSVLGIINGLSKHDK